MSLQLQAFSGSLTLLVRLYNERYRRVIQNTANFISYLFMLLLLRSWGEFIFGAGHEAIDLIHCLQSASFVEVNSQQRVVDSEGEKGKWGGVACWGRKFVWTLLCRPKLPLQTHEGFDMNRQQRGSPSLIHSSISIIIELLWERRTPATRFEGRQSQFSQPTTTTGIQ